MTDWITFFRILTRSRPGFYATLPYEAAVNHPGGDEMASRLYMVPPSDAEANTLDPLAREWMETDGYKEER